MDIVITDTRTRQTIRDYALLGQTITHTIDYNPWADDNGTVTSVTLSLESGQTTIANESLASNVKTFTTAHSEVGASMIKATATAGNNIDIQYIYILTKDPTAKVNDYGICE